MGHIIVLDLLADTGEQDDSDRESDGNTDTIDYALDKIISLLHVCQGYTENSTVCCDQRKIYTQA